jgi:hypothetical protein
MLHFCYWNEKYRFQPYLKKYMVRNQVILRMKWKMLGQIYNVQCNQSEADLIKKNDSFIVKYVCPVNR